MVSSQDLLSAQSREKWKNTLSVDWKWEENSIYLELNFKTFNENRTFVNRLLKLADTHNHHPDIYTSFCYTRVLLTTHDAGGITEKDITMALAINKITH